ncbi:MAG: helix-turn-helix domain-containing protein, partial [Pseudomonadota bacterium]
SRSLQALHRSRTKMMRLGHKSARQRVSDFLYSMAERLCGCSTGTCELTLPMSRRDIGESLGLTIETVSRQFTELKEIGLVETQGRSIVRLLDLNALALEAGQPRPSCKSQEI